MSNSRHNWNWKGRLLDFSGEGARIQMGPGVRGHLGDTCDLLLSIEEHQVAVPSQIANITEGSEGPVFGLRHRIESQEVWKDYSVLLEVVALGSTLSLAVRQTSADESGYRVEQYASAWGSRLTLWREARSGRPAAFELVMNDGIVRAAGGSDLEYLAGTEVAQAVPAEREQIIELYRLFHWVVPSLGEVVPADARDFLRRWI